MSQQACRVGWYLHKPQIPLRQNKIAKSATLIKEERRLRLSLPLGR